MNFLKLKEQIVAVDNIVKVDSPRKVGPVSWQIRTLLNNVSEPIVTSIYSSEDEAKREYERIVLQLCADKE